MYRAEFMSFKQRFQLDCMDSVTGMSSLFTGMLNPFLCGSCWETSLEWPLTSGWSGGVMVLGKLPVLGRSTIRMIVGQGPIALIVGEGRGCLDIFTLL